MSRKDELDRLCSHYTFVHPSLIVIVSYCQCSFFRSFVHFFFNWRKQAQMNFNRMLILGLKSTFQFIVHPFINYSRPNGHLLFNAFNNVTFCFGSICIFYDYSIICIRSIICRFGCLSQDSSHFTMFHREKKICNLFM